jgi:hypothetical protein
MSNRRQFLESVGCGMLAAGLGSTLATELGFSTTFANEGAESLSFGPYDALIDLIQSTPPAKLQPILVEKLHRGEVSLKELTAAGALANAEAFGGEDYTGFHTAMAMLPALSMTEQLPTERQPLPILKVLYRNCAQIQSLGGPSKKTLRAMHAAEEATVEGRDIAIRDACRVADVDKAEKLFAPLAHASLDDAFNILQPAMQDEINVHRFVFAHRTRGLADLLGKDYAYTILRQCVRFCCNHEQSRISRKGAESPMRTLMPKLIDQYKLAAPKFGTRDPGDATVEALARTIYQGPPERSAEAAAAALAEGISPEVVGEAVSLASNMLVLKQGPENWRTHGDSAGVHSSDATNAFRNMARVSRPHLAASGLVVAAYHSAAHSPFKTEAYPTEGHRGTITTTDPAKLLDECEDAIRNNNQGRAAAAIAIYGENGHSPDAVFARLLKYTISEDGRLHGEKFYHTVQEEFRTTRPAFRWRHLVGLARVTASAYGYDRDDKYGRRAPGYEEACRLLKVTA